MINVTGEAWKMAWNQDFDVLCITTNGFVKKNGECVMGRGIAKQMKEMYPELPRLLGRRIQEDGNRCARLMTLFRGALNSSLQIVSFPVKHNWFENADLELIAKSAKEIVAMADEDQWSKILIPRPGCGNGKLSYADVEPVLKELLDDRFYIIGFPGEE